MFLGSVCRGVGQLGFESRSIFIRRRVNIEVFRVGLEVEIFEGFKSFGVVMLEDSKLVVVVFFDNGYDVFIRGIGGKGGVDGEEGVYLFVSFGDLKYYQFLFCYCFNSMMMIIYRVVLVRFGVVLFYMDEEDENRDEGFNSVRLMFESYVGIFNVVVSGNMVSSDFGKESGIIKVNIFYGL